jgi:predicted enzyme related to lactoylglutathione lyase
MCSTPTAWARESAGSGPERSASRLASSSNPARRRAGFRDGDSQSELGVTDRKLAPAEMGAGPGGTVTYWQVDDVAAVFDRLLSLGAKPLQPPTELSRGFIISSVVDPFGNVLGLRFDPDFS